MTNDTDIIALRQPESVDDPLTEVARDGARRMLAAALRADAAATLPDGRQRVVRHGYGYGPERSIQTGIDVQRPKGRRSVSLRRHRLSAVRGAGRIGVSSKTLAFRLRRCLRCNRVFIVAVLVMTGTYVGSAFIAQLFL